ncbi:MAG: SAM-dependent methyltransferase [Gemmatimonadales bacterium]|nr:SAM-dependent methyltransferase [Gemmatimonadales bacterium]
MTLADLSAAADNAVLKDIIVGRITEEGHISFRDFMDLALYHPVHGYYAACDPTRDYQSSPEAHAVFGAVLGRQVADFWRLMGRPARFDVFEAGAGNGRLAGDILAWLRAQEPDLYDAASYVVQDVAYESATARERVERVGLSSDRVAIRQEMPGAGEVEGCILSNELLDALPFHRVRTEGGRPVEVHTGYADGHFVDVLAEPLREVVAYFDALGLAPGEGCEAEVNLAAADWMARAAAALRRGYLLTLDYGYAASELYAPWRRRGTLLTFFRHTPGEDPYVRVGRQDITASVDFTTVARAGESAGLRTLGLATQSAFLQALGIGEALAARPSREGLESYYALRRSIVELTDAAGLGRIKVLIQGRDVSEELPLGLGARPAGNG